MQKTYIIEKDHHSSGNTKGFHFAPQFNKKELIFEAYFEDSCLYDIGTSKNYDINKLLGFSQGFHHKDSCRFGWRCIDGKTIEILSYCYVLGKRVKEVVLGSLKPLETGRFKISLEDTKYKFTFNTLNQHSITEVSRNYTASKLGYGLFPYFGGVTKAPQKMFIHIIKE